jgi:hypothetical protein
MKMLMVVGNEELLPEMQRIIDEHEVHGYTEFTGLAGSGTTGRRMGTRTSPGRVALVITAVGDDKRDALIASFRSLCDACYPTQGIRVFVLPVEQMI